MWSKSSNLSSYRRREATYDGMHKNFRLQYPSSQPKLSNEILSWALNWSSLPPSVFDRRKISYHILKFNLSIPKLYQNLLDIIFKDQCVRDRIKYKIIRLLSDSEHKYNQSYRALIVIESLLFSLFELQPIPDFENPFFLIKKL